MIQIPNKASASGHPLLTQKMNSSQDCGQRSSIKASKIKSMPDSRIFFRSGSKRKRAMKPIPQKSTAKVQVCHQCTWIRP